jgi:hypothetical protein
MLFLWLLGVRALTEEEQLYIRLCRPGKYFFTEEEICTYYWSDLNRVLEFAEVHSIPSMLHSFLCIHKIYCAFMQ